jgi:hypothetical protein
VASAAVALGVQVPVLADLVPERLAQRLVVPAVQVLAQGPVLVVPAVLVQPLPVSVVALRVPRVLARVRQEPVVPDQALVVQVHRGGVPVVPVQRLPSLQLFSAATARTTP